MKVNYEELDKNALRWWPSEIKEMALESSVVTMLLENFDSFVGILAASKPNISSLLTILDNSKISRNLFLKHIAILADFGGEGISRIGDYFEEMIDSDSDGYFLEYKLNNVVSIYRFKSLPVRGLGNKKLLLDKDTLMLSPSDVQKNIIDDVIFLLMFGAFSTNEYVSNVFEDCDIAKFMNKEKELSTYLRSHYIRVSRILGGSTSNDRGQALERYLVSFLKGSLPDSVSIGKGKVQVEGGTIPFDILIEDASKEKFFGIEVSFQVTTNSTIERKGNEAEDRYKKVKAAGGAVGYIIDGAGNIKRKNAIEKLITNSDYVSSLHPKHLKDLVQNIKEEIC